MQELRPDKKAAKDINEYFGETKTKNEVDSGALTVSRFSKVKHNNDSLDFVFSQFANVIAEEAPGVHASLVNQLEQPGS